LANDYTELNDLADQMPEKVEELTRALNEALKTVNIEK
jgi:hypothetical protein